MKLLILNIECIKIYELKLLALPPPTYLRHLLIEKKNKIEETKERMLA